MSTRPKTPLFFFALMLLTCSGCGGAEESTISYSGDPFYGLLAHNDSLYMPEPQEKQERVVEVVDLDIAMTFGVTPEAATDDTPPEQILFTPPIDVVVDEKNGALYLLDKDAHVIKKFSLQDGSLIQIIGNGEGEGPGEFLGAWSLWLLENGTTWVHDGQRKALIGFKGDGALLETHALPLQGSVAVAHSERFVYNSSLNTERLFHVFDAVNKKQQTFGLMAHPLLPEGHGLPYMGYVITDGSDSFLYTNYFGGGLVSFDFDGTFRFFRETIDPNPFPGMTNTTLPDGTLTKTVDSAGEHPPHFILNVYNNVYYDLVVNKPDAGGLFVDAYAYSTGDYLYSIKTPDSCGALAVTAEYVYAQCNEEGLVQLRRSEAREKLN